MKLYISLFVAVVLCHALSASATAVLDMPYWISDPTIDLDANSITQEITAPELGSTWQPLTTAAMYTGSFAPVTGTSGCRTVGDLDFRTVRFECNGIDDIKWEIFSREGLSGINQCTGTKLFEVKQVSRINAVTSQGNGNILYQAYPRSIDIVSNTAVANESTLNFVRNYLGCPVTAHDALPWTSWKTILEANVGQPVSLLSTTFDRCVGTVTIPVSLVILFPSGAADGDSRTYVFSSDYWEPKIGLDWAFHFKEQIAKDKGFTDMSLFDASLSTLPLSSPEVYGYARLRNSPVGTGAQCTATSNKGMYYIAQGELKSETIPPATSADLGNCDSLAFNPEPSSYSALISASTPPSFSYWNTTIRAMFDFPAISGFSYPLRPGAIITSVQHLTKFYAGMDRQFVTYKEVTGITRRASCLDGLGQHVLTHTIQPDKTEEYIYSMQLVFIPGSDMPYWQSKHTYRFIINPTHTSYVLHQIFDTEDDMNAKLLSVKNVACGILEPGGNWTVPWKLEFTYDLSVTTSTGATVGASVIQAIYSQRDLDVSSVIPASGCYNFPTAVLTPAAPVCISGTCTTHVTLSTGCYYPEDDGNTFISECPNIHCSAITYQSSLGLYRFGATMSSCPAGKAWNSADCQIVSTSPREFTTYAAIPVYPLPASSELSYVVTPFMLQSSNATRAEALDDSLTNPPVFTREDFPIVGGYLDDRVADAWSYGVDAASICWGPLAAIQNVLQLQPQNYECSTDTVRGISGHIFWSASATTTDCEGDTECVRIDDSPFKGVSEAACSLPVCEGHKGCDAGGLTVLNIIRMLGIDKMQTSEQQGNAFMYQLVGSVGLLDQVQSTRPLRTYSTANPRTLARILARPIKLKNSAAIRIIHTSEGFEIEMGTETNNAISNDAWTAIQVFGYCIAAIVGVFLVTSIAACAVTGNPCSYKELFEKKCSNPTKGRVKVNDPIEMQHMIEKGPSSSI